MKVSVISAWFVLLATAAYLQKVDGARTPLMNAVDSNNVNLVKSLLGSGVDAKATNNNVVFLDGDNFCKAFAGAQVNLSYHEWRSHE